MVCVCRHDPMYYSTIVRLFSNLRAQEMAWRMSVAASLCTFEVCCVTLNLSQPSPGTKLKKMNWYYHRCHNHALIFVLSIYYSLMDSWESYPYPVGGCFMGCIPWHLVNPSRWWSDDVSMIHIVIKFAYTHTYVSIPFISPFVPSHLRFGDQGLRARGAHVRPLWKKKQQRKPTRPGRCMG